MHDLHSPFITKSFLHSVWADDYEAFRDSDEERALLDRLHRWSGRKNLKETSAEAAFIEEFFCQTWGYAQSGQKGAEGTFTLYPQFPVTGAGAAGKGGRADVALGYFTTADAHQIPQVLCEFKGIKKSLDAPQRRKDDTRTPVQQGLGYLSAARRDMFGNEPIVPMWAMITDMNEFRLYWATRGHRQYLRFIIHSTELFAGTPLLADTDAARFDRFLFQRVFHRDNLIVCGASGRANLERMIARQWVKERELENAFYQEYRHFREQLYTAILEKNGPGTPHFPGTKGRLVRMAQKILDRCIFIFFCEDMGRTLDFPPQILRDFLISESNDAYFEPEATTIWSRLVSLFHAMNDGRAFGGQTLNQFNGGLFAADPALDALAIPNRIFCQPGQGQNEESLNRHKLTLLYLSAAYDYASIWNQGVGNAPTGGNTKGLGLYTLGRIFEQSITELEVLEAEAEGRPSLNKVSQRKRDGVYYTPEWVIDYIVDEAIGKRLAALKEKTGYPGDDSNKLPATEVITAYEEALASIKILDPACGSGAFLITALRYLLDEWQRVREMRKQVGHYKTGERETDEVIRDILKNNLYGVDINPASVEITKLALWLHTARGNRPLSTLDAHIRDGNSLIGSKFYDGLVTYSADEQERINAFDWESAFPQVFDNGGFDVVIGNPPYVKLQNFRKVHADMAGFLKKDAAGNKPYNSTQTGNFDLYLPFIEKGITLLNDAGILGYIAPSLWTMNEYGKGLRQFVMSGRHLYGWIDFQSFQVFEEAITYTALQFYSRARNTHVAIKPAPDGSITENPWSGRDATLPYSRLAFGNRWLMATGAERELIDRLYRNARRLDDPELTRQIFQGLITSADAIYHLKRLAPGRYLCTPKGRNAPQPFEVALEDGIMKPLVSGVAAKRYIEPATDTFLLFPYHVAGDAADLIPANRMATDYPKAWAYLRSYEKELRGREDGKMNDNAKWWGYVYPKNLNKHEIVKLIVAGTVPNMRVCADDGSNFYLNNVRVNGIVPATGVSVWFLLGVLNAPVCDYIFRRIAKPKDCNWYEANKQFIAPLPIPVADKDAQEAIAGRAKKLQDLHTRRRDILHQIARRLHGADSHTKPETWLFSDLETVRSLQERAPKRLSEARKSAWAKRRWAENLNARFAELDSRLTGGNDLEARLHAGELQFLVDGFPVIERVFVPDAEAPFILAQWKRHASTFSPGVKNRGHKLAGALRKICKSDNPALVDQTIALQRDLSAIETRIRDAERGINEHIYTLYDLQPEDIARIEADMTRGLAA